MPRTLTLTDQEVSALTAAIENELEGLGAALQETPGDHNIESAEELLELTGNLADSKASLLAIQKRLT
jgi:hypothetical protein